jgi:hypothetical protein
MKKLLFLFAVMLITIPAIPQKRSKFLYAEISDKSAVLWPFTKVIGNHFDPSLTFGAGLDHWNKGLSSLFQNLQFTGYATPMIGNGITVSSSIGYRYQHSSGIFGEALAGLGASVFYPSMETFTRNEDGIYTADNHLHIRGLFPLDFQVGYMKGRLGIYIKYRYMLIGPYTDVLLDSPILPASHIGIGMRYGLNKKNEQKKGS